MKVIALIVCFQMLVLATGCKPEVSASEFDAFQEPFFRDYNTNTIDGAERALLNGLQAVDKYRKTHKINNIDLNANESFYHERLFLIYQAKHETNKMQYELEQSIECLQRARQSRGEGPLELTPAEFARGLEYLDAGKNVRWKTNNLFQDSGESLAQAVLSIEPWPDGSTNYSHASWKRLVDVAKRLEKADVNLAEDVLQKCQSLETNSVGQIRIDGKIYLLLRVVFEAPEKASANADWRAPGGGWMTMRSEYNVDGTVNRAWPIVWGSGHPRLVSGCMGIQSFHRYNAKEDFRFLHRKCSMRDLSSFESLSSL